MRTIKREIEGETEYINVYDKDDFPYYKFANPNIIKEKKRSYYTNVATFDIETTNIIYPRDSKSRNFAFMYVWQFCIDGIVAMGRTWDEYKTFLERLKTALGKKSTLVCYVHNLNFEFQFMRNFFNVGKIFAKKERNIIKASIEGLEYRCSYALSNMGLLKFTQKTKGVKHKKLDGEEFNYSIKRYPTTHLSDEEVWYCVCDVLGLWECIVSMLEDDTLISIPMTSTGYVRRDYRAVCLNDEEHMDRFHECRLTPEIYLACKESIRGGISGSNACYTSSYNNIIVENMHSRDIKSSYPYQMLTKYYPSTQFWSVKMKYGTDKFDDALNTECCIIRWSCRNLRLKKWTGIPYISKAKCSYIGKGHFGNGKVYSAETVRMFCTEIDFKIIQELYYFEDVDIEDCWCAGRGMLSKVFRQHLHDMFQIKTDLEDGDKYIYDKYKNKINGSFGMSLTDITSPEILYENDSPNPWVKREISSLKKSLMKYYGGKQNFLNYQDGVWITAHARKQLEDGMMICGSSIVQVDTDSCKYVDDGVEIEKAFEDYNKRIIAEAESFDIKPYAIKNGEKHYLGLWEDDGYYKRFATLGAKKYAYDNGDGVKITVAGLNKDSGGKWLTKNGGLEMLKNGTFVPPKYSGRTTALYNDEVTPFTKSVDGNYIVMGSNVAIENVGYTFGVTPEWGEMILESMVKEDYEFDGEGAWEWK